MFINYIHYIIGLLIHFWRNLFTKEKKYIVFLNNDHTYGIYFTKNKIDHLLMDNTILEDFYDDFIYILQENIYKIDINTIVQKDILIKAVTVSEL